MIPNVQHIKESQMLSKGKDAVKKLDLSGVADSYSLANTQLRSPHEEEYNSACKGI